MSKTRNARLRRVAQGGTINGTYRDFPDAALRMFLQDLNDLLDECERRPTSAKK